MRWFVSILLAVAIAVGAILFHLVSHDPSTRLMSDDELIALFRNERASFDSLATMLDQDPGIGMTTGYGTWGLERVSEPRRTAYVRLFHRIRCGWNIWNKEEGILFQQYVEKMASDPKDRWMRGYWYARMPVEKSMVKTSDLMAEEPWHLAPPGIVNYRPLEGHWYLYSNRGYTD